MNNTSSTTTNNTNTVRLDRLRRGLAFGSGIVATLAAGITFAAVGADAVGSDEATFVPITPCRLFDTRPDSNVGPRSSPLGEDETMIQQVTGSNGDCEIPADASGIALNATAVGGTAPSFATFYPADATLPEASNLNYVPGQAPTPNKVDVKLSPSGELAIYNRFGSVHLLADVTGYYTRSGLQGLESEIAALQAKVDGLDTRPSTSASAYEEMRPIDKDALLPITVVAVTVDVDGPGFVELNSSTRLGTGSDGLVRCQITRHMFDESAYDQLFDGTTGSIVGQISGTRIVKVNSGTPQQFVLKCEQTAGTTDSMIFGAHLTAVFTPTP